MPGSTGTKGDASKYTPKPKKIDRTKITDKLAMKIAKIAYIGQSRDIKQYGYSLFNGGELYGYEDEAAEELRRLETMSPTEKGARLAEKINSETYFMSKIASKQLKKEMPELDNSYENRKKFDDNKSKVMGIAIPMFLENHLGKLLTDNKISKEDLKTEEFSNGFESVIDLNSNTNMAKLKVDVSAKSMLKFAKDLPKKDLESMSQEELMSMGYVRIPEFTRNDGTTVKSHIRKLST